MRVLGSWWPAARLSEDLTGPLGGRWRRRSGRGSRLWKAPRRSGKSWLLARRHAVDNLRVIPTCLLARQHRGERPGCPVGHRHREDPVGIATARRARTGRRRRAHRHRPLEDAAVATAVLVDGHSVVRTPLGVEAKTGVCPCNPWSSRVAGSSDQPSLRTACHAASVTGVWEAGGAPTGAPPL
jgi:hypothetical protein